MRERSVADRLSECVVTFGGLGKLPIAGGTWGTLGAALVHALVVRFLGTPAHPYFLPALAFVFALACIFYGPWAERFYGRKDPAPFVIDEVAGYLLAVSFFPARPQFWVGVIAFVFFRIFDILKPFPIRTIERLPHGFGVVADDLVAGLYAALLTGLAIWLFLG